MYVVVLLIKDEEVVLVKEIEVGCCVIFWIFVGWLYVFEEWVGEVDI